MTRVVAALIARDSRILICQRRRDAAFPLKWEFPGGKVDGNESLEAALVRELHEELGVQATVGRELFHTVYQYPEKREPIEVVFFNAQIANQKVSNPEEAFEQIVWVLPADLPKHDFLAANADLIKQVANGTLSIE
jgi:8-oxo-dGTP diphosphatase